MFQADFVEKIKTDPSGSWKFWWLSNTILAVIFTVGLAVFGHVFVTRFADEQLAQVSADAAITFENAQLSTTGIPDPIIWAPEEDFVVVLDTTGETYTPEVLAEYEDGLFVSRDFLVTKDDGVQSIEQPYSEFISKIKEGEGFDETAFDPTTWTITKTHVVGFFDSMLWKIELGLAIFVLFGVWTFFAIVRLMWAAFWGLVLWGVGAAAGLKNWEFEHAFSVMLHWLLPLFVIEGVFTLNGVDLPWWGRGILLVLALAANIWQMRQDKKS